MKIFWNSGVEKNARVNRNGTAYFSGDGIVSHVVAEGETIVLDLKVDGGCTIVGVSRFPHR